MAGRRAGSSGTVGCLVLGILTLGLGACVAPGPADQGATAPEAAASGGGPEAAGGRALPDGEAAYRLALASGAAAEPEAPPAASDPSAPPEAPAEAGTEPQDDIALAADGAPGVPPEDTAAAGAAPADDPERTSTDSAAAGTPGDVAAAEAQPAADREGAAEPEAPEPAVADVRPERPPLDPALYAGPFRGATDPRLALAPERFAVQGEARWNGARTLAGVWVAHPDASRPIRARLINRSTGQAADGAVFRREGMAPDAAMQVSSEAAAALGMRVNRPADLVIVALDHAERPIGPGVENLPIVRLEIEPAAGDGAAPTAATGGNAAAAAPAAQAAPAPDGAADPGGTAATPALADVAPGATSATPDAGSAGSKPPAAPSQAIARASGGADAEATASPSPPPAPTPDLTPARRPDGGDGAADTPPETITKAAPPASPAATAPGPASPGATISAAPDTAPATATGDPASATDEDATPAPPADLAGAPADGGGQTTRTRAEPPAPPTGGFIQVGIFAVPENSAALLERLAAAGIRARGEPLTRQDRVLTRIVAGPFGDVQERDRALRVIESLGIRDARLTPE